MAICYFVLTSLKLDLLRNPFLLLPPSTSLLNNNNNNNNNYEKMDKKRKRKRKVTDVILPPVLELFDEKWECSLLKDSEEILINNSNCKKGKLNKREKNNGQCKSEGWMYRYVGEGEEGGVAGAWLPFNTSCLRVAMVRALLPLLPPAESSLYRRIRQVRHAVFSYAKENYPLQYSTDHMCEKSLKLILNTMSMKFSLNENYKNPIEETNKINANKYKLLNSNNIPISKEYDYSLNDVEEDNLLNQTEINIKNMLNEIYN
jgi:hypothetical protein